MFSIDDISNFVFPQMESPVDSMISAEEMRGLNEAIEQLPAKSGSCCALENSRVVVGVGRGYARRRCLMTYAALRPDRGNVGCSCAASRPVCWMLPCRSARRGIR